MPFIQVEILKGRTPDQRRAFAREVTRIACETLGSRPRSVRIRFVEMDPIDLARGGVLASDGDPDALD